jgi:flagellar assembly protein FliH
MHSFKEFTAEEMAALSPWRLPVMDAENAEPSVAVTQGDVQTPRALTVEEIERMQQEAREEATREGHRHGYEAGYQDGREQGYKDGQAEARADSDQLAVQMNALLTALTQPFAELDQRVVQELVALAIAIAKQLIRRELKTEPGEIVAVVREAMGILPASTRQISLHLNPDDALLLRSNLLLDDTAERWKIVEDPLLTRGGCRVSTETSQIDATVEKRLAAVIARVLGGERENDSHDRDHSVT